MSSLGFQAIYGILNGVDGWAAERAFLPDDVEAWRARAAAARHLRGRAAPVGGFRVVAFSVAYELELAGLVDCLELAGLPLFAAERAARSTRSSSPAGR